MARRQRKRNPSGVIEWAKAHPYLTTFFVLPAVLYFPVRIIRALSPTPAPSSAPTAGPSGAKLMPLDG